GFSLWYILVPGYALALILSFITPRLFVGIAFAQCVTTALHPQNRETRQLFHLRNRTANRVESANYRQRHTEIRHGANRLRTEVGGDRNHAD
ncbi:MAG: DUF1538 domain-containing protein, partial [Bacteroidales bacterium]|nr:DUF1538 domain-containing protein [Bacteroidales bacterium]